MSFKDHFSRQSDKYARYRPGYPPELFAYLASVAPTQETAWDCATGNGQAASGLAERFARVVATDASTEQLANAFPHERIEYTHAPAEESGLAAKSVDLVTVAQALHWFDLDRFYRETQRVLKPGGVLAVWCYSLCRITPDIDAITDAFYFDTVGPYWPAERRLVDDAYRSIPFPFAEWEPPGFSISLRWTLDDLLGYFRTWSPTRIYIEREGRDPVDLIAPALAEAWAGDPGEEKQVLWPLHMRIGRTVLAQPAT